MDIAQSVIVITAAGTPTGRAMAEHFCNMRARVALVDTNQEKLQASYKACLKTKGTCYSFFLANRSVENISHLFEDIRQEMGTVDVLINYWQAGGIPSLLSSDDNLDHTIADVAANLYIFGRCAAFSMLDRGRQGLIVNIPEAQRNDDIAQNFDCSNAVIRGLTQSWAQELEHANIRVAGVLPRSSHQENMTYSKRQRSLINYDMIDGAAYIVENDSFTGRILESAG